MDCEIIEITGNTITIEINNEQIKPFSYILAQSSNQYCCKFLMNSKNLFKNKIVPFFLEHFLLYLGKINQSEQYNYLNGLKNKREQKQFLLEDVIQMCKHKSQKPLQRQWIEYLESEAAIDVSLFIYSKKIRISIVWGILESSVSLILANSLSQDDGFFLWRKQKKPLNDVFVQLFTKKKKQIL